MYSNQVIALVLSLRQPLESEFGYRPRLADPDLLSRLSACLQRTQNTEIRQAITRILQQTGQISARVNPVQRDPEKIRQRIYRGQPVYQ